MATELETKLNQILSEKETKIIPENIKNGVEIFDITGTYTGSSAIPEVKDVNFYDYDGTLVYSYSKTDFLNLTELPANPTHAGLTAQGWNWTLANAKTHVTTFGKLDIGQIYTTTSGKTEIDIELNAQTGTYFTLKMNGTKNWGDGSSEDTNTYHQYSQGGKYTITCDGTINSLSVSSGLFGQSNSNLEYSVKEVRFAGITTLINYAFNGCASVKRVLLDNSVTSIGAATFSSSYSLTTMIIPSSVTEIGSTAFAATGISKVILPNEATTLNAGMCNGASNLKKLTIPSGVTAINNYTFQNCYALELLDFSAVSAVPTLSSTNAFNNMNKSLTIVVPDSLYSTWIADSTWSNFANNIVRVSDY